MARGNLKGTTKGLLGPLALAWFLGFAGLCIAVGGLAALTSSCHATGVTNPNILLASANGIIPYNNCANLYEFQWFHLALQAFVIAGLFVTLVIGMRKFRFGVMALLTISTVFMVLDTNIFLGYDRETRSTGGNFHTRSIVTFVGFLVSAVGNFLAIMLLGAQESTLHPYNSNRAVYGEHDIDPVTGAPVGAGTTGTGTGGGGFFGRKREAEPVVTNV